MCSDTESFWAISLARTVAKRVAWNEVRCMHERETGTRGLSTLPQPDNPVGSCKRSARWRAHHVFDGRPLRDPTSTCQLLLGRWIGLLGRRGPPRHGLPRLVLGQWGRSSQAPTWGESPSTQVERRLEVTFLRLVQRIRDGKTSSHGADLGFLRLVQRIRLSVTRDTPRRRSPTP